MTVVYDKLLDRELLHEHGGSSGSGGLSFTWKFEVLRQKMHQALGILSLIALKRK